LRHYYTSLKSIAGDKLTATFDQLENLYHHQFAVSALHLLVGITMFAELLVKSEGEQKKKDALVFIERAKAGYEDAMKTLGDI